MRSRGWKRYMCAACLSLALAGAYNASALTLPGGATCTQRGAAEAVVHGRRLLTFGGYELNVTFTPAGRVLGFNIAKG